MDLSFIDKWDWKQLYVPSAFRWEYGVTPFSNFFLVPTAIVIYLITIFSIQSWMRNRPAFALKGITQFHNLVLCLWSLAMFLGIGYGAFNKLKADGWFQLLCDTENRDQMKGTWFFWTYSYYLSKYYELLDTVILVLKKKPLSVLHVYHHAVMVFLSWTLPISDWPLHWYGIFTNTLVHVFMYYYYYVATKNIHPWWKKYLTTGQITQFISLIFWTSAWLYVHFFMTNKACAGDTNIVLFTQGVNFSFLLLFINFYLQTYKAGAQKKKQK